MKNLFNKLGPDSILGGLMITLALLPIILLPIIGNFSLFIILNMITGFSKGLFLLCIYMFLYKEMGQMVYAQITLDGTKLENLSGRNIAESGQNTEVNTIWYRVLDFYLFLPAIALTEFMARKLFQVAAVFSMLFLSLIILDIQAPLFGVRQDFEVVAILLAIIIYTQLVLRKIIKPSLIFSDIRIAINRNQAELDDRNEQEEFAKRNALARAQRDEEAFKFQEEFENRKRLARAQRDEEEWNNKHE